MSLHSALIKAHEEADISPRSVIYRLGSTKQCFLKKNQPTSRSPTKILPFLTFIVLYKGTTSLRKRGLPDGSDPSRGERSEPDNRGENNNLIDIKVIPVIDIIQP